MKYLLLFLLMGATVFAQRHDLPEARPDFSRRGPESRVIVFEHANFEGASLVLSPGDSVDDLAGRRFPHGGGLNDGISSIMVEGGAELNVYADARFRGPVLRVTDDIRDLTRRPLAENSRSNWNDRISSLRVEVARRAERGREGDPDGWIRRAYLEFLVRDPQPGEVARFRELVLRKNWTERMVCDELMRTEEYRREGIERIIRRAYHDVLGREPAARDLQVGRRNFLDRRWSERDLCDELRRSDEYRRRTDRHR